MQVMVERTKELGGEREGRRRRGGEGIIINIISQEEKGRQ